MTEILYTYCYSITLSNTLGPPNNGVNIEHPNMKLNVIEIVFDIAF